MATTTQRRRAATTQRRRAAIIAAGAATTVAAILYPTTAHAAPAYTAGEQPLDGHSRAGAPKAAALAGLSTCTEWTAADDGFATIYVPSVGINDGNFGCAMSRGDSSDAVFKLKRALNTCYGTNLASDSNFDQNTVTALQMVQGWFLGVPATGSYGPDTARWMTWPRYDDNGGGLAGGCESLEFGTV